MNHRAYSQKAPESQLHEFKLLKPTALFWLCKCSAWLCWGTQCPLQAIGERSGCLQLSLVPFPESNFSPWRKLVKVLRWSEVMRSMEETDESLDFLTPTGGSDNLRLCWKMGCTSVIHKLILKCERVHLGSCFPSVLYPVFISIKMDSSFSQSSSKGH